MFDMNWLTGEAHRLHDFFQSIFYVIVSLLLVIGIAVEYFRMSLGSMPGFQLILVRSLIAVILLVGYPEVSNTVASVADAASEQLGNFKDMSEVLDKAGDTIHQKSFNWTSAGDLVVMGISYIVYFFLYVSVFFYDSGVVFCLTLLYVFSPLLIALYVLPQTASACSGLFRSIFEVAAWKINFCVLSSLLWNACLKAFDPTTPMGSNYILQLAVILMLAMSVLCTPLIVNSLLQGGITGVASKFSGLIMGAATYGMLSPEKIAKAPFAPGKKAASLALNKVIKPFASGSASLVKEKITKPTTAKAKSFARKMYTAIKKPSSQENPKK